MDILREVTIYKKFKDVLDKVQDGDSIVGLAMREALTVEQLEVMEAHVSQCEDMGIQLLVPHIVN